MHESVDEIYKAADEALYVVKEGGRNGHAFDGEGVRHGHGEA